MFNLVKFNPSLIYFLYKIYVNFITTGNIIVIINKISTYLFSIFNSLNIHKIYKYIQKNKLIYIYSQILEVDEFELIPTSFIFFLKFSAEPPD